MSQYKVTWSVETPKMYLSAGNIKSMSQVIFQYYKAS